MPLHDSSLPVGAGLPRGATDAHVHVFDPSRFGYATGRSYTPGEATVQALREHHAGLGIDQVVLVQASVYGSDNRCLLDAISQLGQERCRGIAVVDLEQVTRARLLALHAAGVRGIRLNLEVDHEADGQRTHARLERAAAVVDLPGWCVQVHCSAVLLPTVQQALGAFRVPLVLDHFAGLQASRLPAGGPHLHTLLALLASGRVYTKLSAFYRASNDAPQHAELAPLVHTLIQARPDRLLWGSDWPHTGGGRDRDPGRIEAFRAVDLAASLAALKGWANDSAVLQQILVSNPAELYGFGPPPVA